MFIIFVLYLVFNLKNRTAMNTLTFTPTRAKMDTNKTAQKIIQAIDNHCQYELNKRRCSIESDYNESEIGFEVICQMFTESSEPDENNQSNIQSQHLSINRLIFFFEGDEIEVENADAIYQAIEKNYQK